MPNLKRSMIRLFAVILSTVLGSLLILGEPAFAIDSGDILPCIVKQGTSCSLKPNTGYKIKQTETNPTDDCYGKTIYAKFTFPGEKFPDGQFEETYPIQDNWELHFNTPLSDRKEGTLTVESPEQCNLEVYEDRTVELLSGFKSKEDFDNNKETGHFVIAKDYYAAIKKGDNGYDECKSGGHHTKKKYCYEPLGSLTTITGNDFPALGGAVIGQITIEPNAIRAPHWHLQFAEVGYCYEGIGQVGVIVPSNTIPKSAGSQEFYQEQIIDEIFVKEDEVFLFPQGSQHYLRNIGSERFKCTLFFTEGTPLDGNQLLTISLQNIVGNTPLGVLEPMFVADKHGVIQNISQSPPQKFTSVDQGPDVIKVVQACRGEKPNIFDPGCPPQSETRENTGAW